MPLGSDGVGKGLTFLSASISEGKGGQRLYRAHGRTWQKLLCECNTEGSWPQTPAGKPHAPARAKCHSSLRQTMLPGRARQAQTQTLRPPRPFLGGPPNSPGATWSPFPTRPWPPCCALPSQGHRAVHARSIYSPDRPC